jgi:hypothetical protein
VKAYERRETSSYPFFKLSSWDARSMTWRAGKSTAGDEAAAKSQARKQGRYRVERFDEAGSVVLEPFEV